MANEQGIVQYIRLALDPESLAQVNIDASEASAKAGQAVADALVDNVALRRAREELVTEVAKTAKDLRKKLEKDLSDNRLGLGGSHGKTVAQVKEEARKIGEAYNAELNAVLAKLPEKLRNPLSAALMATSEEKSGVRPRFIGKELERALDTFPERLRAVREAVNGAEAHLIDLGKASKNAANETRDLNKELETARQRLADVQSIRNAALNSPSGRPGNMSGYDADVANAQATVSRIEAEIAGTYQSTVEAAQKAADERIATERRVVEEQRKAHEQGAAELSTMNKRLQTEAQQAEEIWKRFLANAREAGKQAKANPAMAADIKRSTEEEAHQLFKEHPSLMRNSENLWMDFDRAFNGLGAKVETEVKKTKGKAKAAAKEVGKEVAQAMVDSVEGGLKGLADIARAEFRGGKLGGTQQIKDKRTDVENQGLDIIRNAKIPQQERDRLHREWKSVMDQLEREAIVAGTRAVAGFAEGGRKSTEKVRQMGEDAGKAAEEGFDRTSKKASRRERYQAEKAGDVARLTKATTDVAGNALTQIRDLTSNKDLLKAVPSMVLEQVKAIARKSLDDIDRIFENFEGKVTKNEKLRLQEAVQSAVLTAERQTEESLRKMHGDANAWLKKAGDEGGDAMAKELRADLERIEKETRQRLQKIRELTSVPGSNAHGSTMFGAFTDQGGSRPKSAPRVNIHTGEIRTPDNTPVPEAPHVSVRDAERTARANEITAKLPDKVEQGIEQGAKEAAPEVAKAVEKAVEQGTKKGFGRLWNSLFGDKERPATSTSSEPPLRAPAQLRNPEPRPAPLGAAPKVNITTGGVVRDNLGRELSEADQAARAAAKSVEKVADELNNLATKAAKADDPVKEYYSSLERVNNRIKTLTGGGGGTPPRPPAPPAPPSGPPGDPRDPKASTPTQEGANWASQFWEAAKNKFKQLQASGDIVTFKGAVKAAVEHGQEAANKFKVAFERVRMDWGRLVKVPDAQPLSLSEERSLFKKVKGDLEAYRREVMQAVQAKRIMGAESTKLGRLMKLLGVDIMRTSGDMKAAVAEFTKWGGRVSQFDWGKPATGIKNLAGAAKHLARELGVLYSVWQLFGLLKEAAEAFNETTIAWTRLSISLADVKEKFSEHNEEIRKAVFGYTEITNNQAKYIEGARDMGFNQHQAAEILGTLVQLTGSYEKALKGLPTVMDLVVSRHKSIETSANLVARAMIGDIGALQRHGIFLNENRDAMEELSDMMGREAATQAKTFGGQVKVLNAYWYDFKVALGEAVMSTTGGQKTMQFLIDTLEDMTNWVKANRLAFEALGWIFKAVGLAIWGVVWAADKLWRGLKIVIAGVITPFLTLPNVVQTIMAGLILVVTNRLKDLTWLFDKVFKTDLTKALEQAEKNIQAWGERNGKRTREILGNSWNFMQQSAFGTPERPDTPLAPDFAAGTGGPRVARDDIRLRKRVTSLRTIAMDSEDEEAAQKAVQELNTLLEERKKILEEIKENTKDDAHAGKMVENAQKNVAYIEGVIKDIEKKREGIAQRRKEWTELTHKIELLSRVAVDKDSKDRITALRELDRIHAQLQERQKNTNVLATRYWELEDQIQKIQEVRVRIAERASKTFQDQVSKLERMIELDVNREAAIKRVKELMEALTGEQAIQNVMAQEHLTREEAMLRIAERRVALERAMSTAAGARDRVIEEAGERLNSPETRDRAFRDLLAIQTQLNRLKLAEKTTDAERLIINKQLARIAELTKDDQQETVNRLRAQLKLAKDLAQEARTHSRITVKRTTRTIRGIRPAIPGIGRRTVKQTSESRSTKTTRSSGRGSWEERDRAVQIYKNTIEEITNELDKQNLKQERRLELEAMLLEARQKLLGLEEPDLNMFERMGELLNKDLPSMAEAAADAVSTNMVDTFERLGVSARTLSKTLLNLPKGLAKGMAAEAKQMAIVEAKKDLAWAIREIALAAGAAAHGNFAKAGQHLLSAGKHGLAAAAWGALGGVAGSVAGGGGSAATSGETGQNVDDKMKQTEINITIDGVDPSNPRHQKLVGETVREYAEKGGKLNIKYAGGTK